MALDSLFECKFCGKGFYLTRKRAKDNREGKFCSMNCYNSYRFSLRIKNIVDCKKCGKKFDARDRDRIYCSDACYKVDKKATQHTCSSCGTIFTPIKFLKRKDGVKAHSYMGAKTCSVQCEKAWKQTFEKKRIASVIRSNTGSGNHNWKGGRSILYRMEYGNDWPRIAESIRKRDGYKCQSCGIHQDDLGETLHVHHKIPLANFSNKKKAHSKENLVALCNSCHSTLEHTIKWVQLPLIIEDGRRARTKGRPCRGEEVGGSKLNRFSVLQIRKMFSEGIKGEELAKKFDVASTTIYEVVYGKTWKHVPLVNESRRGIEKGTMKKNAVLNDDLVLELRKKYSEGANPMDLCREYKIGCGVMYPMLKGKTWKHLPILGRPEKRGEA